MHQIVLDPVLLHPAARVQHTELDPSDRRRGGSRVLVDLAGRREVGRRGQLPDREDHFALPRELQLRQ